MNVSGLVSQITVNTQSSIRIGAEKNVYFDPIEIRDKSGDADIVFITHEHGDHFDPGSIRNISREDTVIAAPESMKDQLRAAGFSPEKTVLFSPGGKKEIKGIPVEGVPAYNILKPFHPRRKGWLGYIVTLGNVRVYVAGDTDATKEVKAVRCDVALLPIGGKFTMNAKDAAAAAGSIRPAVCIPTHYGSIVGSRADEEEFRKHVPDGVTVTGKLF